MKKGFNTLFLIFLAFLMVFPMLITVTNSFMKDKEVLDNYFELKKDQLIKVNRF